MNSQDIPGQVELKNVLMQMVDESRLPHAMLLHSNEGGVGLALARYTVQMLFCNQREGGEPCGTCPDCVKNLGAAHPDVHFIFPVNANKSVKKKEDRHSDSYMADWREAINNNPFLELMSWYQSIDIENKQGFIGDEESTALRRKLALRPYEGGHRVFVIWHADKMNASFANKLLKNLEEPSEKTLFILISETPAKLLTTVLSRVQVFREEHISEEELTAYLVKQRGLSEDGAMTIAFRAEGNVNHAISEVEHDEDPWLDEFKSWMRMAYTRDLAGLYRWSEKMARRSRDAQRQYCNSSLKTIDRCYRMGWMEMNIPMEGEEAKFFRDFSPFINTANAKGFLELLEEASFHIERNVSEKMVWFDASISAIRLVYAGQKSVQSA